MERATIEAASLEQFQNEARRFRLPLSDDRKTLIESISWTHLESQESPEQARERRTETVTPEQPVTAAALHQALARITETMLHQ